MGTIQANRPIEITTPLGDDVLVIHSMTATEELGRLFRFELDLLSREPDIKFDKILGQNVTIRLDLPNDKKRYFNGFVSRFSQEGQYENYFAYNATVHPWLWFLTRTADCRIFQEKTVPDIIKEVFKEHGFSDYEESLSGTYRSWPYCVQYRETDFNFVSRLMEQEGIYYYFKHENGKHTLVLSDAYSSHEPYPGYEKLPYYPPDDSKIRERDHIFDWNCTQEIQPGMYALTDFNFTQPKANMLVKSTISRDHAHAGLEIFDYPGEYEVSGEGETYVRTRIEELQAEYEQVQGQGNAKGLAVGSLFQLTNFTREDQNREYLIVSATHQLETGTFTSGGAGGTAPTYTCSFTAQHSKEPFRPARTTPKPMVQGPQTAMVVGPSGEEIHTDKYGRVKVSFHWDRYSKSNETSSCWVRVSQVWAGKQWGAIHIPRMGQEVIVEFLEGDPDHPIITGRVYNDESMPPYDLPANATQSGIKSRSSKGGSPDNFNEFRFEDKKGSEEIYLHGEKDWTINIENDKNQTVGHDETLQVGNNRTKSVGVDQSETIGNNKTISVGVDHSETIGGSKTETIGKNKTETVTINTAETIGVAKELTIGGAYQVSVGAAMNETVGGLKAEEIGALKSVNVGANSSENIGGNKSVNAGKSISEKAGKDVSVNAGKNISESAGENVSIQSGKKMTLSAGDDFAISGKKKGAITIEDELTIKCGKAVISMKKNGDITINGKKITIKGSGDIVIKGSKILEN